jgi:hypothetical protein
MQREAYYNRLNASWTAESCKIFTGITLGVYGRRDVEDNREACAHVRQANGADRSPSRSRQPRALRGDFPAPSCPGEQNEIRNAKQNRLYRMSSKQLFVDISPSRSFLDAA